MIKERSLTQQRDNSLPKGLGGSYEEFDGFVTCEECGKTVAEEDIVFAGRYPVCSHECNMRLRGLA